MSRRDVIIPPFHEPGGALCPIDVEFQLVDENRDPVVGMRVADDEGVTCQLVITTTDQDQTIALTPQDGVYGNTFWRIRIGLIGSANIPLSSRCAKYGEYFVSFADGAPIELSDLLNLAGPGVPGTVPGWEQHLEDPTFTQLHNPSDATDQQIPIWDNAQQKWVAGEQTVHGPPLAHAASHATGGTDELTPAAIGAVAESGESAVQGLSIAVVDAVPGVQTAGVIYFVRSAP